MPQITINLSEDAVKVLKKRAEENLLTLREQVEDILRRSAVNYQSNKNYRAIKADDKLVEIFSRHKSGRTKKH